MKMYILILHIVVEGTVSQKFDYWELIIKQNIAVQNIKVKKLVINCLFSNSNTPDIEHLERVLW